MKLLVAGDFCDRLRVSDSIASGNYEELFGDVRTIIESSDYSIVNFEFPIADSHAKPIFKCGPNLKGSKNSVEALRYAGFNVCTLANNHILDQGEECCLKTKKAIESAGIKTVGVGENIQDASNILYLSKGKETVAVINCCEHEFSIATERTAGANPLNPLQQYYQIQEARKHASYICMIVHGGHEHFQYPSLRMKEMYHFFIDVGADIVINHHQHCYSGYETYHGKSIFYGLGNFCFDGNRAGGDLSWHEGFLLTIDTLNTETDNYKITPYLQCQESATIQLCSDDQKSLFFNRIVNLNRIICNDILLRTEVDSYYEKYTRAELAILEPYRSRIFKKLYNMGIIPSFIKGVRLALISNHVFCESHLDKLRYALSKEVSKTNLKKII